MRDKGYNVSVSGWQGGMAQGGYRRNIGVIHLMDKHDNFAGGFNPQGPPRKPRANA